MNTKTALFSVAALCGLFSAALACAQDVQKNVTYVCSGERLTIDSCTCAISPTHLPAWLGIPTPFFRTAL